MKVVIRFQALFGNEGPVGSFLIAVLVLSYLFLTVSGLDIKSACFAETAHCQVSKISWFGQEG